MIIKLPVSYREEILTAKPPSNDEAYPDQNYPDYLYSEAGVGHIPTRYPVARGGGWFNWAIVAILLFGAGAGCMVLAILGTMTGWF